MKYLEKSLFSFLFSLIVIPGCVKNYGSIQYIGNNNKPILTISNSIVKRGEQLFVSTNESNSNSVIRWTINPTTGTLIIPANNQATVVFAVAGTYQITASYYSLSDTTTAYDSSSSHVTVNDSIYSPPPVGSGLDSASLAGDQITLIPVSASDSGFEILAKTSRLYNCAPYLTAYSTSQSSSSFIFDFRGAEVVEGKGGCMGVKNPAIAYLEFNPATNGTYNISALFNQITYQGSLTVTDTYYTFSWNYSSGIIISPLQIKKN